MRFMSFRLRGRKERCRALLNLAGRSALLASSFRACDITATVAANFGRP